MPAKRTTTSTLIQRLCMTTNTGTTCTTNIHMDQTIRLVNPTDTPTTTHR